jgi:hypothetical protein
MNSDPKSSEQISIACIQDPVCGGMVEINELSTGIDLNFAEDPCEVAGRNDVQLCLPTRLTLKVWLVLVGGSQNLLDLAGRSTERRDRFGEDGQAVTAGVQRGVLARRIIEPAAVEKRLVPWGG